MNFIVSEGLQKNPYFYSQIGVGFIFHPSLLSSDRIEFFVVVIV